MPSESRLPDATTVGPVHLNVRDVDAQATFYAEALGLRAIARRGESVELGADAPVLVLHHEPDAPARPVRATGLYHAAILLPSRSALGAFLRHAVQQRAPLDGASDHLVSEAIYLRDPEGNGLEVYADRPRASWPRPPGGSGVAMATQPLDVEDLLAAAEPAWRGAPRGTRMGHVHLQVGDAGAAEAFYRDALGLDVMARYGPDASFLSAGGYHHHVAVNAWGTRRGPQPPAGALGLREFTLDVPAASFEDVMRRVGGERTVDPSGNALLLRPA